MAPASEDLETTAWMPAPLLEAQQDCEPVARTTSCTRMPRATPPTLEQLLPPKGQQSRARRGCVAAAVVNVVVCGTVLWLYGVGERLPHVDHREIMHFQQAKTMLLPALFLQACYLVSAYSSEGYVRVAGYRLCCLMIFEFIGKLLSYSIMAHMDGGIVHLNQRAFGPPRGCYTVRFAQWAAVVPALLLINSCPLFGPDCSLAFMWHMTPKLLATWTYISCAWLAQVTPNATAGWILVMLAFFTYFIAFVDQMCTVHSCRSRISDRVGFKMGLVYMKEVMFACFGIMYALGICGLVSSFEEQVFYTYGEILLKVAQASALVILRYWEEVGSKQAEVWRGKEDMSHLIQLANAPILSMDVHGRITGWNDHLSRLSGIPQRAALGKNLLGLVDEASREKLETALANCDSGHSTPAVQVTLVPLPEFAAAAELKRTQLLMSLVMQFGGDSSSIVAIGQDLTELVEMKALEARRAVFTATLGHELRSPLHGIVGLAATMAEATSNSQQKRQLTMIQGCAARLLDLVTNIMELAKTEKELASSHVVGVPHGEVNIMDVIDEVVSMTCAAVDKAGRPLISGAVRIVNNMKEGELPVVRGNPYKCTQVFYNLLTNACKFTKSGTVTFSCRHDEASGMLEVDVADTGEGISPAALSRIFEPFEQVAKKDGGAFQGVGLGLSVVLGIVKLHGGSISVQSTVGRGSTFTVRLPCDGRKRAGRTCNPAPEDAGADAPTGEGLVRGAQPSAGLGGKPLLLSVDDDEVNQEVIERTLSSKYRIVRAMNGEEALNYLTSGNELPSMVLLDIMMPGITGFEVCSHIRRNLSLGHQTLPVVMLSARAPAEDTALQSFRCGATDHMQKPFSASIIQARLEVLKSLTTFAGRVPRSSAAAAAGSDEHPSTYTPEDCKCEPDEELLEKLRRALGERDELHAVVEEQAHAAAQQAKRLQLLEKENEALQAALAEAAVSACTAPLAPTHCGDFLAGGAPSSTQGSVGTAVPWARVGGAAVPPERAWLDATAQQPGMRTVAPWAEADGMPSAPPGASAAAAAAHAVRVQSELACALQEADFLREELHRRDAEAAQVLGRLQRHKSEAWLHRQRAAILERQLVHVHGQLGRPGFVPLDCIWAPERALVRPG